MLYLFIDHADHVYITNGMGENVLMNDDINQQAGEGAVGTWGPE